MNHNPKFILQFIDEKALKEYKKLDGSVKKYIDIAFRKLEVRADEIGKPLEQELKSCKEIKCRKIGIRIIFRIINDQVEIVEIIAIASRANEEVFQIAQNRLNRK